MTTESLSAAETEQRPVIMGGGNPRMQIANIAKRAVDLLCDMLDGAEGVNVKHEERANAIIAHYNRLTRIYKAK